MRRMKAILVLWAILFLPDISLAQGKRIKWDVRELAFYDEENVLQRLDVAPKILVRFQGQFSDEERNKFVAQLNPAPSEVKKDQDDSSGYILHFPIETSAVRILELVDEISSSGYAEATPVVYYNNIEAIAEGIVVKPKTIVMPSSMIQRMKKFGEFKVRQSKLEGSAWLFFLDEVKPPLHIYLLANLVDKDVWVERAYPHFRYLHPSITVTVSVEPASGTVDESRIFTLSIKIFDPRIKIRDDELPNFGEGNFVPKSAGSAPPDLFWSVVGDKQVRIISEKRVKITEILWKFRNYALGEWIISSQKISYEKNMEPAEIESGQATFVVTSLIGSLTIDDIPSPKIVSLPEKPEHEFSPMLFEFPKYWFDQWAPDRFIAYHYSWWFTMGIASLTLLWIFYIGMSWAASRIREGRDRKKFVGGLYAVCDRAKDDEVSGEVFSKLRDAVFSIFYVSFQDKLSHHPSLKELKDSLKGEFDHELWETIKEVYEILGEGYAPGFQPDRERILALAAKTRELLRHFEPRLKGIRRQP